MKKIWIAIAILVILAITIVLVVTKTEKETKEIRIGAVLPLTGNMAGFGEWEQRALMLVEEKANRDKILGKTILKFIFEDSRGSATDAVSAVNKLINVDKVKIIFIFKGSLVEAVQPITNQKKVLLLAFAMDPGIARSPFTYRIYPNMDQQSSIMLEYIKSSNFRKIAILYVRTPATQVLVPQLLVPGIGKLGKSAVAAESFEEEDRDIRTQVSKIKASNPDLVITLAHYIFIPNMLTTLKEMGVLDKVKILGGLDYTFPINISEDLLEGVDFVTPVYALRMIDSTNATWFEQEFKTKYGTYPGYDPAFFYDAAMILTEGLKRYGDDIEKLKDYLSTVNDYKGVTGPITINKNRDSEVDMVIGTIQSGKRAVK